MRPKLRSPSRLGWWLALFLPLALAAPCALAGDLKLEALLVWGTNDARSPDPDHKPVGADLLKKLQSFPLKWTHYFEVNRQQLTVPSAGAKKTSLSKECDILVKNIGSGELELVIFGKGQRVGHIKQALPKGELLVTGGNAPNFTAWFVVLRQVD